MKQSKSKFPRKKVIKVLNPYDTTKLKLKPYSLKERNILLGLVSFSIKKHSIIVQDYS